MKNYVLPSSIIIAALIYVLGNRYEIGVNEYVIDKITGTVYRHQNNRTTVYYLNPTEYFKPLTTKRKNTLQESQSEFKTNELLVPIE